MLTAAQDRATRPRMIDSALIVRAGLCLLVMISGLALRRFGFGFGLPSPLVKYGGSLLWATMVFFLVATAASRPSRRSVALMAAAIAVAVELFRLVHAPWLDAFRLTTAGALLLGRVFSLWNLVAYGCGIVLGMWLDRFAMSAFAEAALAARNAPHSAS
jgi:Protein of unknown function (DUF2809)